MRWGVTGVGWVPIGMRDAFLSDPEAYFPPRSLHGHGETFRVFIIGSYLMHGLYFSTFTLLVQVSSLPLLFLHTWEFSSGWVWMENECVGLVLLRNLLTSYNHNYRYIAYPALENYIHTYNNIPYSPFTHIQVMLSNAWSVLFLKWEKNLQYGVLATT